MKKKDEDESRKDLGCALRKVEMKEEKEVGSKTEKCQSFNVHARMWKTENADLHTPVCLT